MKVYGNKIWNSHTQGSDKTVITAGAEYLEPVCAQLDGFGINYCAYAKDGTAYIALNKSDKGYIERLNIKVNSTLESKKQLKIKNIIGNIGYKEIEDKCYRKYDRDFALALADRLDKSGIEFSGRLDGDKKATVTIDRKDADKMNKIVSELKAQRGNELEDDFETAAEVIKELGYTKSQFAAIEPAAELLAWRSFDKYLLEAFSNCFYDTNNLHDEQLKEFALEFRAIYDNLHGTACYFADTTVLREMKEDFEADNKINDFIHERAFNTKQEAAVRELCAIEPISVPWGIVEVIDYTFPADKIFEIGKSFNEHCNSGHVDYAKFNNEFLQIVADIKHAEVRAVDYWLSHGTYLPDLPSDEEYEPFGLENDISSEKTAENLPLERSAETKTDGEVLDELQMLTEEHKNMLAAGDSGENSKHTIVINAFAGPGAGKTTSCLEVTEKLKKLGYIAEYVPEYAKELVWDGKTELLNGSPENQFNVLKEQLRRVDRLVGKVDFVVTDSPVLLNGEYLMKTLDGSTAEKYKALLTELYNQFYNYNYFVERDISAFEAEGRIHSLDESLKIDADLKDLLTEQGIEFETYNHDTIDNIVADAVTYAGGKVSEVQPEKFTDEIVETAEYDFKNEYQLLSRLQRDCEYFLGNDGKSRAEKHLWAGNVKDQIAKMYELYDGFPDDKKPEWITQKDIDLYAVDMLGITEGIDRYYIEPDYERVVQMYYNPNSNEGGQLVRNEFDYNLIREALQKEDLQGDDKAILNYLEEQCTQYCDDVGSFGFPEASEQFLSGTEDFDNEKYDVISELKKLVQPEPEQAQEQPQTVQAEQAVAEVKTFKTKTAPQLSLFDIPSAEIPEKTTSVDELAMEADNAEPQGDNFRIEDDTQGISGAKTKFKNNIAAIETLKQIEADGRAATDEEKKTLSLYSGWGGLAAAFDEKNEKWAKEFTQLKNLLTEAEYSAARDTVLDSYYTAPIIIDGIYKALTQNGFKGGDILEPAMGVGGFFGRLPKSLQNSTALYGIEKDGLTGRIAKTLYPQADITIDGFENTKLQDGSFDLVFGNVPFGSFGVNDPKYNAQNLKIHDYFFCATRS